MQGAPENKFDLGDKKLLNINDKIMDNSQKAK